MPFRITRAAYRDLLEIGRYTRERWGDEQRRRYLTQLDSCFKRLAKDPRSGRACDEIRPGYWRHRQGRHVVFYEVTGKMVVIVRILHERMLPTLHL